MLIVATTFFACGGNEEQKEKIKIQLSKEPVSIPKENKNDATQWLKDELKNEGINPDHGSLESVFGSSKQ
jgi:hypothetical protein